MAGPRSAPRRPAGRRDAGRRRAGWARGPPARPPPRAPFGRRGRPGARRPAGGVTRPAWSEAVRAVLAERRRAVLAATSPAELDALTARDPGAPAAGARRARRGRRPGASTAWSTRPAWCCTRTSAARRSAARRWRGSRSSRPRYSNLELDVRTKARGSRYAHVDGLLRRLSGRRGLARGQQQRRGRPARAGVARAGPRGRGLARRADRDRRRLPRSRTSWPGPGARLVEVGTTNRTRLADYAGAIAPETALLLKVHPSNYRVVGFTESVAHRRARRAGPGARHPGARGSRLRAASSTSGPGVFRASRRCRRRSPPAPTSSPSRATSCSGARRPGSSWAGARSSSVCSQNPLNRALRIDKLTLAALEATLAGLRGSGDGGARDPDPPHAERARPPSSAAARAASSAGSPAAHAHGARPGGRGRSVRGGRRRASPGRAPDRRARARHRAHARPARWMRGSGRDACRSSAASPPTVCSWTAGPSWTTRCRSSPPP